MTRVIAILLVMASVAAFAAETEYFPLQVGNVWVYRLAGAEPTTIEIARAESFGGNTWYLAEGWPGGAPVWLRTDADGNVLRYAPDSNRESMWAAFARREGEPYETSIDPCNTTATIRSKGVKHASPVGEIAAAAVILYPPGACRDAGITREVYAPWIGLVEREVTTIAGPRTYELVYARLGGVTVVSQSELAFGVSLDKSIYPPGTTAAARVSLRHTQPSPLMLTFPTGQTYELIVRAEDGAEVWRWSQGKGFTQAIRRVTLPPGEKNWMVPFPVPEKPGKYTAEASLATSPSGYRASVAFEVSER